MERMQDVPTFSEKLKALRKQRGWSQDRLGQQVGIHGRHIGKYEIGKAMPNAETVIRIAEIFGVSIDFLLRDDLTEAAVDPASRLCDLELLKKFEAVEKLSDEDKRVVEALLDAFVKKRQIEGLLKQ